MDLRRGFAGAAVVVALAATAATAAACSTEHPYIPASASDLGAEKRTNIVLEGTPSLLRRSDFSFVLSSGGKEFFVERGHRYVNISCEGIQGDYEKALPALENEISDGDRETIIVMGDYIGEQTIKAFHLKIGGTFYPVYD